MSIHFKIAVDGPSGAGKSTIAKKVAANLNIEYIDTGAMYRAVGYKMIKQGIPLADREARIEMLSHTTIEFADGNTLLDGMVVNDLIRSSEVSKMASDASALPEVREKLVTLQRKMGETKSVIMDGRDIGTNVFLDAEFKFFLTASVEERALRRWKELQEKGESVALSTVIDDITTRDHNDSTRALNPLKKAEDAIEIDTTKMDIDEVTDFIIRTVQQGKI